MRANTYAPAVDDVWTISLDNLIGSPANAEVIKKNVNENFWFIFVKNIFKKVLFYLTWFLKI